MGEYPLGKHPNTIASRNTFSSTNQPKNRGRKPSQLRKFIKDNNIGSEDIANAAKYLLPLTEHQIREVMKDAKVPLMIRLFARAMMQDMAEGVMNNIMKILERAVGAPSQKLELGGSVIINDTIPDPGAE